MSGLHRGEPVTMVRPGREARLVGLRTRATAVWPWERRWETTCWPVRPVAPRTRKCIVWGDERSRCRDEEFSSVQYLCREDKKFGLCIEGTKELTHESDGVLHLSMNKTSWSVCNSP
jgi:hypothetical protein